MQATAGGEIPEGGGRTDTGPAAWGDLGRPGALVVGLELAPAAKAWLQAASSQRVPGVQQCGQAHAL